MKSQHIKMLCVLYLYTCLYNLNAQQTPVFADYNYNTVIINPAHAGYYPDTDVTLTNRGYFSQIEGGPRTTAVVFSTPMRSENMGLGAGVLYDEIGVTSLTNAFVSYAYKIQFKNNYNRVRWWSHNPSMLSFGLTAGFIHYSEDLISLGIQNDPNFENNINTIIPSLGAGILFNREHIYLGLSAPNLISDVFDSSQNINVENVFYGYGGYRFFATRFQEFLINPSVLLKYVSGAPFQADFNTIVNYKNKFEIGGGYRTDSSINLLAGFQILKRWKFLYSYNQTLRNTVVNNSHGIIIKYHFGNGLM